MESSPYFTTKPLEDRLQVCIVFPFAYSPLWWMWPVIVERLISNTCKKIPRWMMRSIQGEMWPHHLLFGNSRPHAHTPLSHENHPSGSILYPRYSCWLLFYASSESCFGPTIGCNPLINQDLRSFSWPNVHKFHKNIAVKTDHLFNFHSIRMNICSTLIVI